MLADRLVNVDVPVTNSQLVLRLINGLPEASAGYVTYIQNQDLLPPLKQHGIGSNCKKLQFVTNSDDSNGGSSSSHSNPSHNKNKNTYKGKKNSLGKCNDNTNCGRRSG